jgi:hypothetical protein
MMHRRRFLANGFAGLVFMKTALAPHASTDNSESNLQKQKEPSQASNAVPARLGTYYEATVPDTLDLAERARLGLRYFNNITETSLNYEMYFGAHFDDHPASMYAHVTSLGACQEKALEATAFERLMTGSTLNLEREVKMVDMLTSMLGDDGLQWVTADITKKPWMKISEPFVMVHGQGRMMRAMIAWYQYTGDPVWKQRIDRMVEGLEKIVVHKDDYAYIPVYGFYPEEYLRSCYTKKGWRDTVEPTNEKFGEEGSLFNHQGHIPGALANWYVLTGNEHALRLSGELVRFYTKPQFWADWKGGEYPIVEGAEHAHWQGHWHGYINTLRAIFEYSIAASDERLTEFVRDGYEWARQKGCARIGYFDAQGCGCGRIIGLAVKLSYHGVGDYWEDVDQYIRNHGTEMQLVTEDKDFLNALSEHGPPPKDSPEIFTDHAVDRFIGAFAGAPNKSAVYLCCGAHGNMGLFYAWDGTLRHEDGTTRVNLLLNRASPWMDIDSYLPYEGKVVLKNKGSREVFVRMPVWVDRKHVRCSIGQKDVQGVWFNNSLRFRSLQPDDVLTIRFPMKTKTEEWTIPRVSGTQGPEMQLHTCKFKGNTLAEMSPPLVPGSPLYQRSYFLNKEAPMKNVTRFATPLVLKW